MRRILLTAFYGAVIFVCLAAGFGYAVKSIKTDAVIGSFVHNGQWYTDKYFGSRDANPRIRAYVAIVGIMALSKKETVYYMLREDDHGEALQAGQTYEIVGKAPPSRWWSITLYNDDHFFVPNPFDRYSVRGTDVQLEEDGSFRILLSKENYGENWIPTENGKDMTLILRMYNPSSHVEHNLETIELPVLRKVRA